MDKRQLNISGILHSLINSIPYPTVILNFDFNLVTLNDKFENQFGSQLSFDIAKILEYTLLEQLKKKFLLLRENKSVEKLESVPISINDKTNYYNLKIDRFTIEDEEYFILMFEAQKESSETFTDLSLSISDSIKSFLDDSLIEIFYSVSRVIPFTLVELNRFKKIIDIRDEPIWLMQNDGSVILSNQSFKIFFGINIENVRKSKIDSIFYPYQLSIINPAIEYSKLTRKAIVLNGMIFTNNPKNNYSLILIPLNDKEGKYFYTVGIVTNQQEKSASSAVYLSEVIDNIPTPVILISKDRKIQHANEEFIKLAIGNLEDFEGREFEQIFPDQLTDIINEFWESVLSKKEFDINENLIPVEKGASKYTLQIKKNYNENDEIESLLLVIYQSNATVNLENLIKLRGRMFDILIQKNPEPIFIYDKENLRFLEVNDAALELYGYSRDEFLQLDLTDLYSPEDIQTLLDSFSDTDLDKKFSKPFRHKKKDGTTIYVEISRFSFKFNDQDAHFTVVREVTDKIELNKKFQIFSSLFDYTSDPVIMTDPFGFIKEFNTAVIEKLGYDESDLKDSSFITLTADEERGIVNTSIFQPPVKEEKKLNLSIKQKEGGTIQAEILATPVLDIDNEVESFTILIRIPEEKSILEQPNETVKEVIKEVVVEKPVTVSGKNEIPESAFLSGVFHELLTPLNVIFGFSQEIIESLTNPTPEQQEAAEIINQNRVKLLDTMNSVIEYSEIIQNRSPITISEVLITDLIDKLDKQIQDLVGANDIQYGYGKISSSLKFETDREKFERMISGLIKIVARIVREKKIYFSAFPIDENSFMVSLSDQYGSISGYLSNTLEKLFEQDRDPKDVGAPKLTTHLTKFFLQLLKGKFVKQVNFAGRTECGFVFPLKLSEKQISEGIEPSFTGQSEFAEVITEAKPDSEEQVKTETTPEEQISSQVEKTEEEFEPVTPVSEILSSKLPEDQKISLKEQEEPNELTEISKELDKDLEEISESVESAQEILQPEKQTAPPTVDLSKLNCLYIEDQVDSQILFKVQLKGLKDIQFAPSFEDALPLLDKYTFDFIVIDINLQGEYNGLDALKLIHKIPGYENTPIIAVTAYVLPGDKEKFIAAGFDDFIAKPIFREKMIDSLQKIFLSKS